MNVFYMLLIQLQTRQSHFPWLAFSLETEIKITWLLRLLGRTNTWRPERVQQECLTWSRGNERMHSPGSDV